MNATAAAYSDKPLQTLPFKVSGRQEMTTYQSMIQAEDKRLKIAPFTVENLIEYWEKHIRNDLHELIHIAVKIDPADLQNSMLLSAGLIFLKYISNCTDSTYKTGSNNIVVHPFARWDYLMRIYDYYYIGDNIDIALLYTQEKNSGYDFSLPSDYGSIHIEPTALTEFIKELDKVTGPSHCDIETLADIFEYFYFVYSCLTGVDRYSTPFTKPEQMKVFTLGRKMMSMYRFLSGAGV